MEGFNLKNIEFFNKYLWRFLSYLESARMQYVK